MSNEAEFSETLRAIIATVECLRDRGKAHELLARSPAWDHIYAHLVQDDSVPFDVIDAACRKTPDMTVQQSAAAFAILAYAFGDEKPSALFRATKKAPIQPHRKAKPPDPTPQDDHPSTPPGDPPPAPTWRDKIIAIAACKGQPETEGGARNYLIAVYKAMSGVFSSVLSLLSEHAQNASLAPLTQDELEAAIDWAGLRKAPVHTG